VTQPPYGPQHPDPSSPVPTGPSYGAGYGSGYGSSPAYGATTAYSPTAGFDPGYGIPAAIPPAESGTGKRRTRRRIAIGAAVVGAVALGGGGYAVAAYLSGGGAQPEEVLPADTAAFVKVDFDPAMGQKTAVASLMDKFPALGDGTEDIRQGAVDQLLDLGDAKLDYAKDVDPWLGDRMAGALVPDDAADAGVAMVLVLAVDDESAMYDALRSLGDDPGFGYAVRDDFLLLAEDQETADRIAAEDSRLSEDDDYVADRAALDGDQIAVAWADLPALQQLFGEAFGGGGAVPPGLGADLAGRVVFGLHAEDDAVELVGMDFTVSDVGPGPQPDQPTRLIQQLPEDTLAAISVSDAGGMLGERWDDIEATGMVQPLQDMFPDLVLPDDIQTILGSDLVVGVFGHVPGQPAFGVRAVTDDAERATSVLKGFDYAFDLGIRTVPASVDDGYVLAADVTAARALAGEDAGLGDSAAFQAAVPGADDATAIGYADLATILEQLPQGGGFRASDYEAVQAFGFSSTPTDKGTRQVLRITTR
jgi:hypothetical protein